MKVVDLVLLTFLLTVSVRAEETPGMEIFGGYAYANARFNHARQMNTGWNGWNASFSGNVNDWIGIVADFSGHHDSSKVQAPVLLGTCPPICLPMISLNVRAHEFLFGPRFSYKKERITPFAQTLFGVAHVTNSTTLAVPVLAPLFHASTSQDGFAMALGGGLDLNFSKRVAWRNQTDYLTSLFHRMQSTLRFSSGIAIRF